MVNQNSIQQTATAVPCCLRVALEPDLGEMLRDPMTLALMQADHVDRGTLDNVIASARESLRWHGAN